MHGPNSFCSQKRADSIDDTRVGEVVHLTVKQLKRGQPMQAKRTGNGCEPSTAPKSSR